MTRGPAKQFDPNLALQRAMQLFWAKGYEGTSLSDLLAAMQIGKKSMYDTFGNKRQLFEAALDLYSSQTLNEVKSLLGRPGSPLQNVIDMLGEWERLDTRPGSVGCMIGVNMAHFDITDKQMTRRLRDWIANLEDAIVVALERAQDTGELSALLDVRNTARMFVATAQGAALISRVNPGRASLQGMFEACRKVLCAA